jgi:hypothetical protein
MDLLAFLTWQFIFFSLGIIAVMFVLRTISEYLFPKLVGSNFWDKLVLPISPILFGGGMAWLLKAYPYATGFTTWGDHVIYGMVAGLLSGLIYKVVKGMIGNQIQSIVGAVANSLGVKLPFSKK